MKASDVVSWIPVVLAKLRIVWQKWDIHTYVLASLTLQLLLILAGPFRKQTSNGFIIGLIWFFYLSADWVAAQAVGLISKGPDLVSGYDAAQEHLHAFWAQFLLLHLGGPDSITALALEDNELWLRTALHLGVQAFFTFGILVKSVSSSNLWAPTLIMFFVGNIKYLERIFSLIYGRLMNSDNALDGFAKFPQEYEPTDACVIEHFEPNSYSNLQPGTLAALDRNKNTTLTDVEMVRDAFYFFIFYKGLYADHQLEYRDKAKSRSYFLLRTPKEAFRVLEIHLNFVYEALYTKVLVLHNKIWHRCRCVAILLQVVCLVIWLLSGKQGFKSYEVVITYTLLIGAIAVEVFAFSRIQLSDWNIAHINKESRVRSCFYNKLLSARTKDVPYWQKLKRVLFRRWSESIQQLSLINYCVDERSAKKENLLQFFGIKEFFDDRKYVTKKMFSNHLRDFIFEELWEKSILIQNSSQVAGYICHCKGNLARERAGIAEDSSIGFVLNRDKEYEDILLVWHVITLLLYHEEVNIGMAKEEYREMSKTLSCYMIYLHVQHPNMMSAVTGKSKFRIEKACNYIKDLCKDQKSQEISKERHLGACRIVVESAIHAKETQQLVGLLIPSNMMEELEGLERKWEFMARVWLELVCYAAVRCRANLYMTQLKQGGGLLSFVWLLMHQFGFGTQHSSDFDVSYAANKLASINPSLIEYARRHLHHSRKSLSNPA